MSHKQDEVEKSKNKAEKLKVWAKLQFLPDRDKPLKIRQNIDEQVYVGK